MPGTEAARIKGVLRPREPEWECPFEAAGARKAVGKGERGLAGGDQYEAGAFGELIALCMDVGPARLRV